MDEFRALAKAIRRPMRRWWLRVGSWWLLLLLVIIVLDLEPVKEELRLWSGYWHWFDLTLFNGWKVLLLGFWLYAGSVAIRLIDGLSQSTAAVRSPGMMRARFALVYSQGIPAFLLLVIGQLLSAWLFHHSRGNPSPISGALSEYMVYSLREVHSVALTAIFLLALLLLVPSRPVLPWAWLGVISVSLLAYDASRFWLNWWRSAGTTGAGGPSSFDCSNWFGLLFSAALYWGMLLLFRYHREVLAYAAYYALLVLTVIEKALLSLAVPAHMSGAYTLPGLVSSDPTKASLIGGIVMSVTNCPHFFPAYQGFEYVDPASREQLVVVLSIFFVQIPRFGGQAFLAAFLNFCWVVLVFVLASVLLSRSRPL